MFTLFFFLYLLSSPHRICDGYPLPFADSLPPVDNSPSHPLVKPPLFVFDQTRGVREIIWSCLTTTFACTWISVHPNISARGESWWTINRRRIKIMLWAIVVPEMILWWAWRQSASASRMRRKYEDKGWTKCHGFFIQMGGFVLSESVTDDPETGRILSIEDLEVLHQAERIEWPSITVEEIWDKSKGDLLSKSFILFQASWFIAQCILRVIYQLPVTAVELVTLGYALLNAMLYALWWNKPLDVRRPIHIPLLRKPQDGASHGNGDGDSVHRLTLSDNGTTDSSSCSITVDALDLTSDISSTIPSSTPPTVVNEGTKEHIVHPTTTNNIADFTQMIVSRCWDSAIRGVSRFVDSIRVAIRKERSFKAFIEVLIKRPFDTHIVRPLADLSRCDIIPPNARRVPTFYAAEVVSTDRPSSHPVSENMRWVCAFAIPIGAIHFTADMSTFPTSAERAIWVTASLLTSLLPVVFALFSPIVAHGFTSNGPLRFIKGLRCSRVLIITGIVIYIGSRIMLLVQALVLLRELPQKALDTVPWINYFPHL